MAKLRKEKNLSLSRILGEDWEFESHHNTNEDESKDSIILGWKKFDWTPVIQTWHMQLHYAKIRNSGGYAFHLTIVYGESKLAKRKSLWQELTTLKHQMGRWVWLMAWDYNKILAPNERMGRR